MGEAQPVDTWSPGGATARRDAAVSDVRAQGPADEASGCRPGASPSTVRPAARSMGAGVGRSDAPALERQPREHHPDRAAALRPRVLPVPRQRARQRRPQPGLPGHVRVHQRLRGAPAGQPDRPPGRTACWSRRASAAPAGSSASRPATTWAWRAWPSPDIRTRGRHVGGPDHGARRAAIAGSRCSRTGAPRWAHRTRIRTARSGRARRCPPTPPARTRRSARTPRQHRRRLLLDYAAQEQGGPRVVEEDADWLVVVPFWAVWPYETLILPLGPGGPPGRPGRRRGATRWPAVLSRLLQRYDTLFQRPFPFSMGWHQAPFGSRADRPLAAARARLAAAAAPERAQVHGRLRAAGRAAAGHHARRTPPRSCVTRARARPATGEPGSIPAASPALTSDRGMTGVQARAGTSSRSTRARHRRAPSCSTGRGRPVGDGPARDHPAPPVARARRARRRRRSGRRQLAVAREALAAAGAEASDIAAIGITNQRETTIVWDRATGLPVAPAIVWQSRITAARCEALRAAGHEQRVRALTGLPLDAYFSGPKIAHILDADARPASPGGGGRAGLRHGRHLARVAADRRSGPCDRRQQCQPDAAVRHPSARLGPVAVRGDGRAAADAAGRGQLQRRRRRDASPAWFGAPIPIAGIAGDQQAATFGQACFRPGSAKNTYGTGAFLLQQRRRPRPVAATHGLLTTVLWRLGDGGPVAYAVEGFRVRRRAPPSSGCATACVPSTPRPTWSAWRPAHPGMTGVYLVPAFTGLGAPVVGSDGARAAHRHHPRHRAVAHRAGDHRFHRLPGARRPRRACRRR